METGQGAMTHEYFCKLVNETPELLSLLYDLDLLPEQVGGDSMEEKKAKLIAAHFDKIQRRLMVKQYDGKSFVFCPWRSKPFIPDEVDPHY